MAVAHFLWYTRLFLPLLTGFVPVHYCGRSLLWRSIFAPVLEVFSSITNVESCKMQLQNNLYETRRRCEKFLLLIIFGKILNTFARPKFLPLVDYLRARHIYTYFGKHWHGLSAYIFRNKYLFSFAKRRRLINAWGLNKRLHGQNNINTINLFGGFFGQNLTIR